MANKLWHKQEYEDTAMYLVFRRWLMMGALDRDVDEAYRLETGKSYNSNGELLVAPRHIRDAYLGKTLLTDVSPIPWEDRAKAFDAEQERKDFALWMKRRKTIKSREYDLAELLMNKAQEMLDWPIYEEVEEEREDGIIVIKKPSKWSIRDTSSMIKVASELARLSAEMEQSIHKVVLSLSPEAMKAIEDLESLGVDYGAVIANFERILIQTVNQYSSREKKLN